MNTSLLDLPPYPFDALRNLLADVQPTSKKTLIDLSTSEPKHPAPRVIRHALEQHLVSINRYPSPKGILALRQAIVQWLNKRFHLPNSMLSAEAHILPINGIRDGLFTIAQALLKDQPSASVMIPNPFYPMYEGVALLANANLIYVPVTAETDFLPDFSQVTEAQWSSCRLIYLSSPSNPHGKVIDRPTWRFLLDKADQYGFVLVSDECYSDLYTDERNPPLGLLQVCAEEERNELHNCLVLHSLSKRSNVPGMRSGFIAGDARLIKQLLGYRTYQGSAMPLPIQEASLMGWQDEQHVKDNRAVYRAKREAVAERLLKDIPDLVIPKEGFYFWLPTPDCDQSFARFTYQHEHLVVLPGSLLSRDINQQNPGYGYIRVAITASLTDCIEGANRLCRAYHLYNAQLFKQSVLS
jgi:N-succinyldiaminopimelate aminotransferase